MYFENESKNDTGIQQDMNELINWYTANKLFVNLDKCGILPFASGKPEEIQMMNDTIPYKKSCKYLGIHLDSSLRFYHQMDYVVKNLGKFCGLIYRIRYLYDKKMPFNVLQLVCKNCYLLWFIHLRRSC